MVAALSHQSLDESRANSLQRGRIEQLALHPTVKPVSLFADAVLDCPAPGDLVLDTFCGSGTVLLAAERTGRRACALDSTPAMSTSP